ncbi:flagellar basal body rod C-terminal domain-containing protein [Sphingomonas sp. MMS24-JH45]
MIETSTVDMGGQMTGMMVALRQADAGGRVFQVWDDLMSSAVTTFGQATR